MCDLGSFFCILYVWTTKKMEEHKTTGSWPCWKLFICHCKNFYSKVWHQTMTMMSHAVFCASVHDYKTSTHLTFDNRKQITGTNYKDEVSLPKVRLQPPSIQDSSTAQKDGSERSLSQPAFLVLLHGWKTCRLGQGHVSNGNEVEEFEPEALNTNDLTGCRMWRPRWMNAWTPYSCLWRDQVTFRTTAQSEMVSYCIFTSVTCFSLTNYKAFLSTMIWCSHTSPH